MISRQKMKKKTFKLIFRNIHFSLQMYSCITNVIPLAYNFNQKSGCFFFLLFSILFQSATFGVFH